MSMKKLLIDLYMSKENDMHERNDNEVWVSHLSECQAKREFDNQRKKEGSLNIFPMLRGIAIHKGLQELIKDAVSEVEKKVTYQVDGMNINGSVDVVLKDGTPVEIKTVHRLLFPAYPEHVFQLQLYIFMLNVQKGLLFYILDNDVHEVTVYADGSVISDDGSSLLPMVPITSNYLKQIVKQYKEGKRVHPFSECNRCFYRSICPFSLSK